MKNNAEIATPKESLKPSTLFAYAIVVFYFLIALAGVFDWLPDFQERVGTQYQPPSFDQVGMWLGTDIFGRSVLYKILSGAKTAMLIAALTTVIIIPIGIIFGAVAGYFGGWVDRLVTGIYSVIVSIPYILLVIGVSYVLGKGLFGICIAMGLVGWVNLCRLVRGDFIRLREREFILAAKLMGASDLRVIVRHMLPNVWHLVIVTASLEMVAAIKSEVILTYLGVGVQTGASWGNMIADAPGELLSGIWWPILSVTVAMFFVVYSINVLGDHLRERL
jgi:peptide/nickel transport system permease protein